MRSEMTETSTGSAGLPRWFDLLAAALGTCILMPLFLLIWLLVRLDSSGPVLFRQRRIGRAGRPFDCHKFRTMAEGAPGPRVEISDLTSYVFNPRRTARDPRLTPLGAMLRRTSLDELPQLLNVIRGQMALVGPRPELPEIVAQFPAAYRRRHAVLPGISGLAQVSGRSDLTMEQIVRHDLFYVDTRSARLDLVLLWRTLGTVFRGEGAR